MWLFLMKKMDILFHKTLSNAFKNQVVFIWSTLPLELRFLPCSMQVMNQTMIKLFQKHRVNQIDRKEAYSFDTWGIFEEKSCASFLQNFATNLESPNQEHGQKMKNFVTWTSS